MSLTQFTEAKYYIKTNEVIQHLRELLEQKDFLSMQINSFI